MKKESVGIPEMDKEDIIVDLKCIRECRYINKLSIDADQA